MSGVLGNLFSGNTNTSGTTYGTGTQNATSNVTNTGQTSGTYDPRYGTFIGQALPGLAGLYDPARSLALGSAAPISYSGDVQPLLDPYAQSRIAAYQSSMQPQWADQQANLKGSLAQQGALTGSGYGGAKARLSDLQQREASKAAQDIYGQSYGQALGAALQNRSLMGSAAGTYGQLGSQQMGALTNLVGAGGGTNTGTSAGTQAGTSSGTTTNYGQSNQNTQYNPSPWSILSGLGGLAMQVPWGSIGGALGGIFSDERVKDNIVPVGKTFEGLPIYKFNYVGDDRQQIGLLAQDVEQMHPEAVGEVGGVKTVNYDQATKGAERKADGGSVGSGMKGLDFPGKVMHAFKAFRQMQDMAKGGAIKGYDEGGWVTDTRNDLGAPISPDWEQNVIEQANYNQGVQDATGGWGSKLKALGQGLTQMSDNLSKPPQGMTAPPNTSAAAAAAASNNPAMAQLGMAMQGRRGYDAGGEVMTPFGPVSRLGDNSDYAPPEPADSNSVSRISQPPAFSPPATSPAATPPIAPVSRGYRSASEVLDSLGYKPMSKWDVLSTGLMSTPSGVPGLAGPFSGIAGAIMKDREAQREAAKLVADVGQLTGQMPGGVLTEAARHQRATEPYDIRLKQAMAAKAETEADRQFLLELEKEKLRFAKEVELAQLKAKAEVADQIIGGGTEGGAPANARPNTRYRWTPAPPEPLPEVEAPRPLPPGGPPPAAAPTAPAPEYRTRTGSIPGATPQHPLAAKHAAGYGQYYYGPPDETGKRTVWQRGSMRSGDRYIGRAEQ